MIRRLGVLCFVPAARASTLSSALDCLIAHRGYCSRANNAATRGQVPTSATPRSTTLKSSTPQGSTPQGSTPKSSTPKSSTPQGSTPKSSTAQSSTAQSSTAQSSTAQSTTLKSTTLKSTTLKSTTPKSTTPQGTTPQGTTPQGSTPQGSATSEKGEKFSTNGLIKSDEIFFMVFPDTQRLHELLKAGQYIMIYGGRGTGKSTYVQYCCDHNLPEGWWFIYISFEDLYGVPEATMWGTIWLRILDKLPQGATARVAAPDNVLDFTEAVRSIGPSPFVLVMDEFDAVLSNPAVREKMLHALRALRDYNKTSTSKKQNLKAVVAIGPISIVNQTFHVKKLSPFNIAESYSSPYFTRSEVEMLFEQYTRVSKFQIDPKIVDNIFALSNGHKGFVSFCGRMVQMKPLRTLEEWLVFAEQQLPKRLITWPTAERMTDALQSDPRIFEFLSISFLRTKTGTKDEILEKDPYRAIALEAAALGILESDELRQKFWIPSALVRAVIEASAFPPPTSPRFVSDDIPFDRVVIEAIQGMDGRSIKLATSQGFGHKYPGSTTPQLKRDSLVPNEEVYSFAWRSSARKLLSSIWDLQPFVKPPNDETRSCDLVVTNRRYGLPVWTSYAVEFCANTRENPVRPAKEDPGTLIGHFDRTDRYYSKIDYAKSGWVINFTTATDSPEWAAGEQRPPNINVVHVHHKLDWSFVQCKINGGEYITLIEDGKIIELKS